MKPVNAAERVRKRIKQWLKDEGHGSHQRLARAVAAKFGQTKSASWVTDISRDPADERKRHDVRLRDLDAIADALGMPVGELVRREDHYIEATPTELRLIRYFRALPHEGKQHWIAHLDALFAPLEREMAAQAQERDEQTARARTGRRRLG